MDKMIIQSNFLQLLNETGERGVNVDLMEAIKTSLQFKDNDEMMLDGDRGGDFLSMCKFITPDDPRPSEVVVMLPVRMKLEYELNEEYEEDDGDDIHNQLVKENENRPEEWNPSDEELDRLLEEFSEMCEHYSLKDYLLTLDSDDITYRIIERYGVEQVINKLYMYYINKGHAFQSLFMNDQQELSTFKLK